MRKALLPLLLVLLLPGIASAQAFVRYYPPSGVAELTSSGTAITSTVPFLLANGTAGAPAYSFSSYTTTGIYNPGGASISFSAGGSEKMRIGSSSVQLGTQALGFGANPSTNDSSISRESAGVYQFGPDAATASAQTIKGSDSTGANVAGASLTIRAGAGTSGNATGGQLILGGGANAGSGERGAVQIEDGGTKPTCAAGIRGSVWYDAGDAGVADTFEVCAKQAAGDSYAWRALATIP